MNISDTIRGATWEAVVCSRKPLELGICLGLTHGRVEPRVIELLGQVVPVPLAVFPLQRHSVDGLLVPDKKLLLGLQDGVDQAHRLLVLNPAPDLVRVDLDLDRLHLRLRRRSPPTCSRAPMSL